MYTDLSLTYTVLNLAYKDPNLYLYSLLQRPQISRDITHVLLPESPYRHICPPTLLCS